jgi:hypothetical protein
MVSFQIVKPVCVSTQLWCPLTKKCEKNCVTNLEGQQKITASISGHTCQTTTNAQYCSGEETCGAVLRCPTSISK